MSPRPHAVWWILVESTHSDVKAHRQIAQQVGLIMEPTIEIIGQAKHGVLARGEASVYIRTFCRTRRRRITASTIWDNAAGMIVVEEAGGMVTDVDGQALDFSQGERADSQSWNLSDKWGTTSTAAGVHP